MERGAFLLCLVRLWIGIAGLAQAAAPEATRSQFLRNVIADHFVARVAAFARSVPALTKSMDALCQSPDSETLVAARAAWIDSTLAWESASAIAFGPLVERRSVVRIDYWPARSQLIEHALINPPSTIKGLELIGGPAKGLPGLEWLLWTPPDSPTVLSDRKRCAYARLLAAEIAEEADGLDAAFVALADSGLPDATADDTFAGLLNLALEGLEQLGVKKIEAPGEYGKGKGFPQMPSGRTAAAWDAQWTSLRDFFIADGRNRNDNLEFYLRAHELGDAADKMRTAADGVTKTLRATREATPATARSVSKAMKLMRKAVVDDVARGLKIPVQFGDDDGD
jgi:uncharacterized protein